jgi:hypothetical protein
MTDYVSLARADAVAAGLNPDVFVAQIQQESGFNPSALSSAGAIGIAQFMPMTAAAYGIDPHDPVASLKAAAQYDKVSLNTYGGSYPKMLAAYNAGGGAVNTAVAKGGANWLTYLPTETQNYVKKILGNTNTPAGSTTTQASGTPASSGSSSTTGLLATLKTWGEYAAIFGLALLLMIIGLLLLAGKQVTQVAEKAVKTAVIA